MTTNQSSNLRPCPFCGGEAFYIKIMGNYEKPHEIFCSKCDGAITEGRSEKQVVTNWNTRPIEDELQKRIAELKVFIDQLIEVGDNLDCVISVISTTVPYGDPYLEQSEWAALVRNWKEG